MSTEARLPHEQPKQSEEIVSISDASAPSIGKVVFQPGQWNVYTVTSQDLKILEGVSKDTGLDFSVFLACVTTAVTASAALATGQMSPNVEIWFAALIWASVGLGIIHFVKWWRKRNSFAEVVADIKSTHRSA